jgi:hypothetical protein
MAEPSSPFVVTPNLFPDEAAAVRYFEERGCTVVTADVDAAGRGLHWHDFEALTAVISGSLSGTDEHGQPFLAEAGSLLHAPAQALHTEATPGGRFVYGFPGGLPDRAQPINRDPADHPSRA